MTHDAPGAEVERRQTVALTPSELLPDDDQIRRMFRIAEALQLSGAYKDVNRPEQAFAKMMVGRDLGLTPAQSMNGIHLVDGGIQMHYSTLGQFVRSRDGYDYRAGWIKVEQVPCEEQAAGEPTAYEDRQVFVWHDEEDPLDDRPVFGAAVVFTVDGEQRGLSRFTLDDAEKAQLIKRDKPKAAWNTSPRNMLLARAMSNGVKWFVPEVMNGMPVYAMGELEQARETKALTDGTGSDDDSGSGVDLGPQVEKIIERATELGHAGLSNRASLELALGQRAPGVVKDWVGRAKAELDRFAAEKEAAAAAGADEPVAGPIEEPEAVVDAEPVAEDAAAPETAEEAVEDAAPVEDVIQPSESTDPRDHTGHRITMKREDGDDVMKCADCDVVLEVPDADGE